MKVDIICNQRAGSSWRPSPALPRGVLVEASPRPALSRSLGLRGGPEEPKSSGDGPQPGGPELGTTCPSEHQCVRVSKTVRKGPFQEAQHSFPRVGLESAPRPFNWFPAPQLELS